MKPKAEFAARRGMLILIAAILCCMFTPVRGWVQSPGEEGPAPKRAQVRRTLPGTQDLQLIIELSEPSVVQRLAQSTPAALAGGRRALLESSRMDLNSPAAVDQKNRIALLQQQLRERLIALEGVQVQGAVSVALNAVIARVPARQYSAVKRLAGIRRVHIARLYKKSLDAAAGVVNASPAWSAAGGRSAAGKGVKIGIIDSGIDIDNPMFVDNALTPPAGYPKGELSLTNKKIIVARNYISLLPNPQSVKTAVDEDGHGSFVAGCAAGKSVAAPLATISGMAPGAFLGSYKIFGTPGINDFASSAAIIAAIDDAASDGMNIVNLSLGSADWLPAGEDPEVTAVNNAIAAGVVVTISAGNDGPGTHTINSPGTAPDAITVGSVSNSRLFASHLHVTAPVPVPGGLADIAYTLGTGPTIPAKIPAAPIADVATLDGDGLGCSAFPAGSFTGKIAFILRGTCFFLDKVTNATKAGAKAVIVYNHVAGAPPIVMGNLGSTTIPAVMISNLNGLALKTFIAANPSTSQVSIDSSNTRTSTAVTPAIVSDFSSRGPGNDFDIKPDLVAVGENVYSAVQNNYANGTLYDTSQFSIASGTSFSSPMVAGAAAVVKQLHPSFTPYAIKSALVNTASRGVTTDGTSVADIVQAGAGLLDMGSSISIGALFSPSSLSFGVSSYSGTLSVTRTLTISNAYSTLDHFNITLQPITSGTSLRLSQTSTAALSPGGSTTVDLTVTANAPFSGAFEGFISIQSSATGSVYIVPYWGGAYIPDSSRILTVTKGSASGNIYASLADALGAARPGNIIEIADSETYDGALLINTNNDGLPLHGVTIRATAGATPVVSTTSDQPYNLQVVGLQNVLLQGLKLSGGQTGLLLSQVSNSQPLAVTVDHCTIADNSGGNAPVAVEVDGATLSVTHSIITGTVGEGIVASNGALLTVLGTTFAVSGNSAIDADSSDVQILDSTLSGGVGPLVYLSSSSGTAEGNTFSNSIGTFADGIQVVDGVFTIRNNIFASNARAGVSLFAGTGGGAQAVITGNTFQSNVYGALFNPARFVRMDSNLVKDNGRGVRCTGTTRGLLANNIIVRSTDASLGDGIQVAGNAVVQIFNNTIYKNKHRGISRDFTATVTAANSIVAGNVNGDLESLSAPDIQFSLVGDGSQTGGNNISGDPKFTNADGDDFSLGSGSPALDAGSNAIVPLPYLDYNGRLRVASPGSRTGSGKVDMGALEAGSSYPLVFPLLANGSQPVLGDDFTTGFAVLNPGSVSQPVEFTSFDPNGSLLSGSLNPAFYNFGPASQAATLGYQLFGFDPGSSQTGSVLASAAQKLVGFFLVFDRQFRRFADGVDVGSEASTDLIFMRHLFDSTGKSTYVVVNPGTNQANVTATLYTVEGTILSNPKILAIPPMGQTLFAFDAVTISTGYVRVQSDQPVSGLELIGNSDELAALKAVPPSTNGRIFFPHFATNQGYSTMIGIVNSADLPEDLLLMAHREDGSRIGPVVRRSLAPGALLFESVGTLFQIPAGNMTTGYITAQGSGGGIVGYTAFQWDDGRVKAEAAVPASAISRKTLLFSHLAHQIPAGSGGNMLTGIALLNPYGAPVHYTLKVFNGAGQKQAETSDVLKPGQKVAKLLSYPIPGSGFFTQSLPLGNGHVEVDSDYGLLGFELFFAEDVSQLVSVPAQIP